jgi:hypothetical protein
MWVMYKKTIFPLARTLGYEPSVEDKLWLFRSPVVTIAYNTKTREWRLAQRGVCGSCDYEGLIGLLYKYEPSPAKR